MDVKSMAACWVVDHHRFGFGNLLANVFGGCLPQHMCVVAGGAWDLLSTSAHQLRLL